MRFIYSFLMAALAALAAGGTARGQSPETGNVVPGLSPLPFRLAQAPVNPTDVKGKSPEEELATLQKGLTELRKQQVAAQAAAQQDAKMRKQLELQQKQIETLERMIRLLAEQVRKQPPGGAAVDKLQTQVATLESRAEQAAQRDEDLARAVDDLNELRDADRRNGPWLPAGLKELFLLSGTNETPLSIYGQLLFGYHQFSDRPGQFESPQFSPYFLLQLNQQFFLETNIDLTRTGVDLPTAQMDWILSDWSTLVIGRYLTPIGFFNERLNHEWINRLPDPALMFRQVSPLISTNGVQARGAFYLGCSAVKLEYSLYGGNGFQAGTAAANLTQTADLGNLIGGPDTIDARALGGRLGFWIPEWGLTGGVSGYMNGRYSSGASDQLNLWQLDAGYHKGNWDVRFEAAQMYQQATSYIGNNIRRTGLYAQVAYQPRDSEIRYLQNVEVVLRYSMARFNGIDPTQLDPTAFGDPRDIPVDRDQYTVGVNYYLYPSMALRFAYEINHELGPVNLHDNVFLSQFVWSF